MSTSQGVTCTIPIGALISTSESQIVKLRFAVLRASDLPDDRLGLGEYFVSLKTSAGWTADTDWMKGKDPEWNQEFLCDVNATSPTLSVDVLSVGSTRNAHLVAIAFLDLARCLDPSPTDILDNACPLLSPSDHTPLGEATISYSCSLHQDGRPAVEPTSRALQKPVQGQDVIPEVTVPDESCLVTAFASSPITDDTSNFVGRPRKITSDIRLYGKLSWTVSNATQKASSMRLWGVEKEESIGPLEEHRDWVTSFVFSPDGKEVAGSQVNECRDKLTGTDCMEDMIVRFSGRKIPDDLPPTDRRKAIDSILNDPKVKHRIVFRQWPLLPSQPVPKPELPLQSKRIPNGIGRWGSTLFDFFSVQPTASERTFTTGSRLLNGEYGRVNPKAKDCIAWAEKEKDPQLVPVFNIATLIKQLERSALADKAHEEEGRMQQATELDTDKNHDEAMLSRPSAAYPVPWTDVVPFNESGPWNYNTLPALEEYIPQSRLPQTLIVHDPWNVLLADYNRSYGVHTPWNEQVQANPDCVHTYTLSPSHIAAHTTRREADEGVLYQKEADRKRILDAFLANPHSLTPRPSGLEIWGSYTDSLDVPMKPAIYVVLPPRPPLAAASEAHLYLSPTHLAGEGNHSFVYHAEWELPRSCLVEERICIRCVTEDVEAIVREQDGENGETRDPKWDRLSGKVVLRVTHTPPITVMMTTEGSLEGPKEYVLREGQESKEVVYKGPYRVVHSRVKYQNLARAPYCKHFRVLKSSIHPLTSKVRVIAKLSIQHDHHLDREAKNYQRFPIHFFQHWSGYNLLPPLPGPIPVGPVVPQFYGYYTPKESNTGRYLSPILLLEDCGEPIHPERLSSDDKQECASLGLKFHLNKLVHGSFYQRNILRKPGPLSSHPDERVENTKKRGGYGVDWSYRLVDFGRSAYVETKTDYIQAEALYKEHVNVRDWVAGKKRLD